MWELAPWNLENIRKSTNNLSFLCKFFINEITASDAGPDIIIYEETGIPIQHNYVDMHDYAAYKLNYVLCRHRSFFKQELSFLFHFENS